MMFHAKYFDEDEFLCPCCGRLPSSGINPRLLEVLDKVREAIGQPLIVSSGYRCPIHNDDVGGVINSQHCIGNAADVYAEGVTPLKLAALAEDAGADGIGIYDDFCHIDTRGSFARWCEW